MTSDSARNRENRRVIVLLWFIAMAALLATTSCQMPSRDKTQGRNAATLEADGYPTMSVTRIATMGAPAEPLRVCGAPCWAGELIPGKTTQAEAEEFLSTVTGFPSGQIHRSYGDYYLSFNLRYLPDILPMPDELGGRAYLYFHDSHLEIITRQPLRELDSEEVFQIYGVPDQVLLTSSSVDGYSVHMLYWEGIQIVGILSTPYRGPYAIELTKDNIEVFEITFLPPVEDGNVVDLFTSPGGWPNSRDDSEAIMQYTGQWRGYGRYDVLEPWMFEPSEE